MLDQLEDIIVFPAAGYLAMALEAVAQIRELDRDYVPDTTSYEIRNLTLVAPLTIPENVQGVEVLLTLSPTLLSGSSSYKTRHSFRVSSLNQLNGESQFVEHALGEVDSFIDEKSKTPP